MPGVSMTGIIWLAFYTIIGLGIVIIWIVKADSSRNFLKKDAERLKGELERIKRENFMLKEDMRSMNTGRVLFSGEVLADDNEASGVTSDMFLKKAMEKSEELERENKQLRDDLKEARSSLEEVYKALCEK